MVGVAISCIGNEYTDSKVAVPPINMMIDHRGLDVDGLSQRAPPRTQHIRPNSVVAGTVVSVWASDATCALRRGYGQVTSASWKSPLRYY